MTTNDAHGHSTDDWSLYDEGRASFSLKTWRISVDESKDKLLELITNPVLPEDAEALSVLAHEYHHWVTSFCSTYGLLVNVFRHATGGTATTLANILVGTCGDLRKPCLEALRDGSDHLETRDRLDSLIQEYTNGTRFVSLLVGSKPSPYADFCDLLPDVLEVFIRAKNQLPSYADSSTDYAGLRHTWTTGEGLESLSLDTEFLEVLKGRFKPLTQKHDEGLDLHLQLGEYDRLNWPTLLEGHAKYFQRAYEGFLIGTAPGFTEDKHHEAVHGIKDYEQWNSPYSRLRRLMRTVMGKDSAFCDCSEIVTLLALADLAENPSLHEDYFFPNERGQTMQTLFPGQRFAWACTAAKRVKNIAERLVERGFEANSLESVYKEFISDCCDYLKWEAPWIQAERWLNRYPEFSDGNMSGFLPLDHFLQGCKLRVDNPLFFGIPSHATQRLNDNRFLNWLMVLAQSMTIPCFAAQDSFPLLFLGEKRKNPVLPEQICSVKHEILDQLMLCPGPLKWDQIMATFGQDEDLNQTLRDHIKRDLSSAGIDLEGLVCEANSKP